VRDEETEAAVKKAAVLALVVAAMHLMACVSTLALGYTLAMSDFDRSPTVASRLGHAVAWVHQAVLEQPLNPLARSGAPWDWVRGYGGLALNSGVWGMVAGLLSVVVSRAGTKRAG
jgi:hypothetical protein